MIARAIVSGKGKRPLDSSLQLIRNKLDMTTTFNCESISDPYNLPNSMEITCKVLGIKDGIGIQRTRVSARVFNSDFSPETININRDFIENLIKGDVSKIEGIKSTSVLSSDRIVSPKHHTDHHENTLLKIEADDGAKCVAVVTSSFEKDKGEESSTSGDQFGLEPEQEEDKPECRCSLSYIYSNSNPIEGVSSKDLVALVEELVFDNLIKEKSKKKDRIFMVKEGHRGLEPVPIKVDWSDIKIKPEYYNESFTGANEEINKFFTDEANGKLCLIHGGAGTGKTTYIKSLISKYGDEGTKFFFLPNSMVGAITSPSALGFFQKIKGGILVIEDAEQALMDRKVSSSVDSVSNILNICDGILSDVFDIKVIATFNGEKGDLDSALQRKSRMHYMYEFKPLEEDRAKTLADSLGKDLSEIDGETTLADVFCLGDSNGAEKQEKKVIGFQ